MAKHRPSPLLLLLLLLCLALAACGSVSRNQEEPPAEVPPPADETQPVALERLTVELVVSWEDADRMLSQLEELSGFWKSALAETGYEAEEVAVTISTAGGFTGDALAQGGVDIACLPAVDYAAWETGSTAILTTAEEVPTGIIAVTNAREELDQTFHEALAAAFTESGAGSAFLSTYSPDATYIPATGEAIQAIRDWGSQQEQAEGAN